MTRRYSLARDLSEMQQMLERLPEYLLGDKLTLPLAANFSRRSALPQLSLGNLLLRRRRLRCLRDTLNPRQQERLAAELERHDALQGEWTLHYGNKLRGELPARLRQMRPFFRDCQDDPSGCASAYPPEALRRTLIQEILLAINEFEYDQRETVAGVAEADRALRRLLKPGEFIWAPELRTVYPSGEFWWLFGWPA